MDYPYAKTKRNYARLHWRKGREFINGLKDVPCADCGERYPPYVMQFDHRAGKVDNLSSMASHKTEKILAEAAKCDIVCANCHAIRTHCRNANDGTGTSP